MHHGDRDPLPARLEILGRRYRCLSCLKRDGFAVNLLLEEDQPDGVPARKWVLKRSRVPGLERPLRWLACWLSRREYASYLDLQDTAFVPRLGPRPDACSFLHEYVEGTTLGRARAEGVGLSQTFFDDLRRAFAVLHARGYAYADTAKKGNIIVGADGRPYLVDFQVTLRPKSVPWPFGPAYAALVRRVQREDVYHCCKHKRRRYPELWTAEDERMFRRSGLNAVHGLVRKPYLVMKRRFWPHSTDGD